MTTPPALADRQLVAVPGGRLEVFMSGPAPLTLVTTHPFQYFGDDGGPLFRPLAAHGRAVVVNPRGTGGSSDASHESISLVQLVEDLEAVRRSLGLTTWIVMGQSMGGCVALEYALRHPSSISLLVLSCTTARGIADEPLSVYHPDNPRHATVRAELAAGRSNSVRQLVAHQPHLVADEPSGGISNDRHAAYLTELPTLAHLSRLEEITVPTLVIGGRHDQAVPVHHAEELAKHIKHAELVVFEHSGHFPYLEEPDRYTSTLKQHLNFSPNESSTAR